MFRHDLQLIAACLMLEINELVTDAAGRIKLNAVQMSGEPGITVQLATSNASEAGANKLRRKLSKIFQRSILLRSLAALPDARGTFGNSQGNNCQSPRTQR